MFTNIDRYYLRLIDAKLDLLLEQEMGDMATMQDLIDTVAAQTTVIDSAVTFIQGLEERLTAAGADPAKIAQVKADIEANTDKIANAIAHNTSAADEVHAASM